MKELSLQNTRLDGRYDVLRLLGRGSYAEIFLARDNAAANDSPHKFVVIKALNVLLQDAPDPELERTLVENFQNEAQALDRVRHPNVINRLGHGTARDLHGTIFHYLILEYLPGGNLSELCRSEPLSFQRTIFYLEQVCAGLQFAHEKGIIHRDIKPQNLLLTENHETVKIADFGVARFAELETPITRVGTNVYAAPEHSPSMMTGNLANSTLNQKLTPAADVYSLAKTVYSILFCESPRRFANSQITDIPEKYRNKRWTNDVLQVLKRATELPPSKRYQSVEEFWKEFALINEKISAESTSLTPSLTSTSLRNFVPNAPLSPSFSSLPNVQTSINENPSEQFSQKPKIVVDLNKKSPQSSVAQETRPTQFKQVHDNRLTSHAPASLPVTNQNGYAVNQNSPELVENERAPRLAGFFKRLLVAAILIAGFSAVLYGTFIYLQNHGMLPILPSSINVFSGQKGFANKNAWLRSAPEGGNNQIGVVTDGSELKIYGKSLDGNWYDVEIVKQGQPDKSATTALRGWVGKSIVDFK